MLDQHLCIPLHDGMCLSILATCVDSGQRLLSLPRYIRLSSAVTLPVPRLAARPKAPENTHIALGPLQVSKSFEEAEKTWAKILQFQRIGTALARILPVFLECLPSGTTTESHICHTVRTP